MLSRPQIVYQGYLSLYNITHITETHHELKYSRKLISEKIIASAETSQENSTSIPNDFVYLQSVIYTIPL